MNNIFILSLLISFAMISCQKQDSAVEQQLAQQKAELDAREKELGERVNALGERVDVLDGRVKALAEKEKSTLNTRTTATGVRDQTPDPAQVQAEREKVQQFADQMRSLIPTDSKMKAQRDREKQAQRAQSRPGLDKIRSQKQRQLQTSGGAVFPSAETSSPTPSPAVEGSSPAASPGVEETSSSSSPTP